MILLSSVVGELEQLCHALGNLQTIFNNSMDMENGFKKTARKNATFEVYMCFRHLKYDNMNWPEMISGEGYRRRLCIVITLNFM